MYFCRGAVRGFIRFASFVCSLQLMVQCMLRPWPSLWKAVHLSGVNKLSLNSLFMHVWENACVWMRLVFGAAFSAPNLACLPPSSQPPTQEGHSAPLSASNPVCPEEIEGSGRPRHTRGTANTITGLSQTLNGALHLFNKAKRGRRDQFNTRPRLEWKEGK